MPANLRELCTLQSWLSIFNGFVLLKPKGIVISDGTKDDILKKLRISHRDIEQTKNSLSETVCWSNFDKDIATAVSNFDACS